MRDPQKHILKFLENNITNFLTVPMKRKFYKSVRSFYRVQGNPITMRKHDKLFSQPLHIFQFPNYVKNNHNYCHSLIRGVLIQSFPVGAKNFTNYVFCHVQLFSGVIQNIENRCAILTPVCL